MKVTGSPLSQACDDEELQGAGSTDAGEPGCRSTRPRTSPTDLPADLPTDE